MCLRIRQGTQRRTFKSIAAEQRVSHDFYLRDHEIIVALADAYYEPEGVDPLEHWSTCLWPEPAPPATEQPGCIADQDAQIAFLKEHAGHVLTEDEMDTVVVKLVRGRQLSTHARLQTLGVHPSEGRLHYQRMRRRHSRGMEKLRMALGRLRRDGEAMRRYRYRHELDACRECRSACDRASHVKPATAEGYRTSAEAGELSHIA